MKAGNLKKKFKPNVDAFFAWQLGGTMSLLVASIMTLNAGDIATTIMTSIKNGWAAMAGSSASADLMSQFGAGSGKVNGQAASGVMSAPQGGVGIYEAGFTPETWAENMSSILTGGLAVVAYSFALVDALIKKGKTKNLAKGMKALGIEGDENIVFMRNGEEISAKEAKNYYFDRRRKGEWASHIALDLLPGALMLGRGLQLTATSLFMLGHAAATGTLFASATALAVPLFMLAAGLAFTYGATKLLKGNNPDFEFAKIPGYIGRVFTGKGFGFSTKHLQSDEDKVTFKRRGDDTEYDLEETAEKGAEFIRARKEQQKEEQRKPATTTPQPVPGSVPML